MRIKERNSNSEHYRKCELRFQSISSRCTHTVDSGGSSPEAVLNALQDLWGNVVRCAAEGGGGVSWTDPFLAHAIVSELDVPLMVQQNIVQLEVSVDDA